MLKKNSTQIDFNTWYDSLNKTNMLLMFKGDFNQDLINSIVLLIERLPTISDETAVFKTRMSVAIIECLQNICRHGEDYGDNINMKPGILLISKEEDKYVIGIGNPVLTSKVKDLHEYLKKVSNLNQEELKDFHKKVLVNSELYGKHGADLGLINLARKSSNKFKFDFREMDNKYTFFSFELYISTVSE